MLGIFGLVQVMCLSLCGHCDKDNQMLLVCALSSLLHFFFLRHPFVFQATHLAPYATNNDLEIAYCMPCIEHLSP